MSASKAAAKARERALAVYPDDTRTTDNRVAWTHAAGNERTMWTAVIYGHTWIISRVAWGRCWVVQRDDVIAWPVDGQTLSQLKLRAVEKAADDGPPCPECNYPAEPVHGGFCILCQKNR